MPNPLVSIIIPTLNRAHLIEETLDSVLAQTYQNWECIVVDDGSTDNTAELMEAYNAKDSRFQYHHRPEDSLPGGNAARNYGFEISNGDYIQWFDSDDLMMPNFLEFKISHFPKQTDLLITSGYEWNPSLNKKGHVSIAIENDLFTDYALWKLKIFTPSVLFTKSFLEDKPLFREDLLRGQETEFLCRIFADVKEKRVLLYDEPLFLYRQHHQSKSEQNKNYIAEFKLSQAIIYIGNLKRGISFDNNIVVEFSLNVVLGVLFDAFSNKDLKTVQYIRASLTEVFQKNNLKMKLGFFIGSQLLLFTHRSRYYFKQKWKTRFLQAIYK